ncbi:hypothetical protein PBRA_009144 [Plasmodiophora brassicae]|uniref:Uncharacterized protein n=1 Tax=Plasmodiophora brassicae TaxID=37360 RepID=A0A0G4J4Q9_PLABS|nr:hypothetical protein PBRA_009144 [Plasmodiophora brassicae]
MTTHIGVAGTAATAAAPVGGDAATVPDDRNAAGAAADDEVQRLRDQIIEMHMAQMERVLALKRVTSGRAEKRRRLATSIAPACLNGVDCVMGDDLPQEVVRRLQQVHALLRALQERIADPTSMDDPVDVAGRFASTAARLIEDDISMIRECRQSWVEARLQQWLHGRHTLMARQSAFRPVRVQHPTQDQGAGVAPHHSPPPTATPPTPGPAPSAALRQAPAPIVPYSAHGHAASSSSSIVDTDSHLTLQ